MTTFDMRDQAYLTPDSLQDLHQWLSREGIPSEKCKAFTYDFPALNAELYPTPNRGGNGVRHHTVVRYSVKTAMPTLAYRVEPPKQPS